MHLNFPYFKHADWLLKLVKQLMRVEQNTRHRFFASMAGLDTTEQLNEL